MSSQHNPHQNPPPIHPNPNFPPMAPQPFPHYPPNMIPAQIPHTPPPPQPPVFYNPPHYPQPMYPAPPPEPVYYPPPTVALQGLYPSHNPAVVPNPPVFFVLTGPPPNFRRHNRGRRSTYRRKSHIHHRPNTYTLPNPECTHPTDTASGTMSMDGAEAQAEVQAVTPPTAIKSSDIVKECEQGECLDIGTDTQCTPVTPDGAEDTSDVVNGLQVLPENLQSAGDG